MREMKVYYFTVFLTLIVTILGGLIGGALALFNFYPILVVALGWVAVALYAIIGILVIKTKEGIK